ncbi:Peptidyl-prolyl cis-trans isomerase CWC27 like protein [Eufriesea mexicana]|uniref:Peptidyl-prolyl cis-trans isomerase CWC27 like protein n=1 Tax=Eufriesea mexicana TaxID=516756 RepID=A0A310SBJ2_9HYME|nr:Peptidyl-prolyl cis-trans isomerase CWC27 like protein [Eufriesea mexicana]
MGIYNRRKILDSWNITSIEPLGAKNYYIWAENTEAEIQVSDLQLCMEGYQDDNIFQRIIKGLITQGGDPTDTGEGCKIYGEPFKNNRLLYPPRLLKSIILSNPFSVIISRITVENSEEVKDSSKTKTAVVKDFNLLSFAEEAEEDEEECVILNKMFSDKGKSACDHLTDPRLSLQPTVELLGLANKKRKEDHSRDWESNDEIKIAMKERIKNKLMDAKKKPKIVENCKIDDVEDGKDIKENEEGIKNSV